MAALFWGRRLERRDQNALRVEVPNDVGDRAVFTAGVHRLEHDQQGALAFGVETLVQLEQLVAVLLGFAESLLVAALQTGSGVGIDSGHPEHAVAGLCPEQVANLPLRHGREV